VFVGIAGETRLSPYNIPLKRFVYRRTRNTENGDFSSARYKTHARSWNLNKGRRWPERGRIKYPFLGVIIFGGNWKSTLAAAIPSRNLFIYYYYYYYNHHRRCCRRRLRLARYYIVVLAERGTVINLSRYSIIILLYFVFYRADV
jgi:hypothetical protein